MLQCYVSHYAPSTNTAGYVKKHAVAGTGEGGGHGGKVPPPCPLVLNKKKKKTTSSRHNI